jgi:hypothetical protein
VAGGLALGIFCLAVGFALVVDAYDIGTRLIGYYAKTAATHRQRAYFASNERALRIGFGIAFLVIGAGAVASATG